MPHTYAHMHILVFLPTALGGTSPERLGKVPLYKGLCYLCKAPTERVLCHIHTHIYTFQSFVLQI